MDLTDFLKPVLHELKNSGASNLPDEEALSERLRSHPELMSSLDNDEELREFFNRTLVSIIRLVLRPDQDPISKALAGLKAALLDNATIAELERHAVALKDAFIQEQITGRQNKSHQNGQPHTPPDTDVAPDFQIKEVYLTILGELNVDLGKEYQKKLGALRKSIMLEDDPGLLSEKQAAIEEIVRDYASQMYEERNKAKNYMTEVAGQLAKLEEFLSSSLGHMRDAQTSNQQFVKQLESEVRETATSTKTVREIDQLRKLVMHKLKTINDVVKEQNQKGAAQVGKAAEDLHTLHTRFEGIQQVIHRQRKEKKLLLQKLQIDPLTGAYNRYYYEVRLLQEFKRFQRYNHPFSLAVFDLDYFKNINDGYGHIIGDKCLKELASGVAAVLRENDALIRFGGDEFVALLPETGKDQAVLVAEKIRQCVETTEFTVRGQKLPVTVSVGVAEVKEIDPDYKSVFSRADTALYQAKTAGRNKVQIA